MKKNLIRRLLVFITVAFTMVLICVSISAASASLWFTDPGVIVGNNVSVVVDVKGSDIGGYQMNISYDSAYLEFVSAKGATNWFSGKDKGGVIEVSDMNDSGTSSKMSFTLIFKTKKTGTTKLNPSEYRFFDGGGDAIAPGAIGDSTINIVPVPEASSDATLKSFTVSGGVLTPEFSASVLDYSLSVDYSVTSLTVSAIKNHNGASVYVSGNDVLVEGENNVTITVTAENGAKKIYTIKVTRGRNPLGSEIFVAVGEASGEIANTIDETAIPKGFEATLLTVNNKELSALMYDEKALPAVYILGGETVKEGFYFIDVEKMSAYPFEYVGPADNAMLLLDINIADVPEGYILGKYTIDGVERDAFVPKNAETPNHCLIYGIGAFGEKTLYMYDPAENTFQRYGFAEMGEPETLPETTDTEDTKNAPESEDDKKDNDSKSEPKGITNIFKWCFLGIGVLIIILAIVAIVLKVKYY